MGDARIDAARLSDEELGIIERAGRARAWDEGETHALGRAIVEVVAEVRASWSECEKLKAALRSFAYETGPNGNPRCEGNWGTGYICGVDSDGRDIYGFTAFCRYCRARVLVGSAPQTQTGDEPRG